jgi:plasmid stability protein
MSNLTIWNAPPELKEKVKFFATWHGISVSAAMMKALADYFKVEVELPSQGGKRDGAGRPKK